MSYAQLVPIDEQELSDMTGQAFFNIDRSSDIDQNLDFTKLTFGLEVKTLLTSDLVDLGNYTRDNVDGSDIKINDFALGTIDSAGNVVPFEIQDPFIELAFEDDAGQQNLVGVRLGFGGAKGVLSGTIESLTGNINVDIKDTASGLAADGSFLAQLSSVLLASNPIGAKAELVNENGEINNIRATKIGIVNGEAFDIFASGGDAGLLRLVNVLPGTSCEQSGGGVFGTGCTHLEVEANDCEALGIGVCFDLNTYNALDIGSKQSDDSFDFAEGLFLSFQSESVTWSDGTDTTPGAFFNIPNGGLEVTLEQALTGTDRVRTKYVDPYFGGN
jgi:hypothetical protein